MFITLDEVIATAQSTIKTATSQDKLLWRQWVALLCLPELGISEEDVKTTTLYPVDFSAPKPPDMKALIEVSLFDANGCQLNHKFRSGSKRIFKDTRIPSGAIVDTTLQAIANQLPVDISDDAYSFHLGTNADKVGAIVVRYYVYQTDEQGLPMIRQEEALAVIFFLRFMHAMRQNESRSEIQQNREMWASESDRIRAKKKMYSLSNDKMKTIIKSTWMRAIPSFRFSDF